jgi:hypothetical protein
MSATLHQRLVQRAVAGKYELFLGVGGGCTLLGLILFIGALRSGQADRAWQLFHVNWLYFTGLAGGSVAFVQDMRSTRGEPAGGHRSMCVQISPGRHSRTRCSIVLAGRRIDTSACGWPRIAIACFTPRM